jgi:hypothetical protein
MQWVYIINLSPKMDVATKDSSFKKEILDIELETTVDSHLNNLNL